jgi:hypothetical protein
MKNIIANGDIDRSNDFCNLIEKNLLLLNDIGYLSLFEFCNKPDSELIALGINWMLMSLASVALAAYATYSATGAYAATAGLSPPMALFITAVATHLILVAHFLILVFWVVETYQWINFKLGKNNLNTCIENIEKNIKVNNQLFAWAVLGLHESNKLPTDVSTHIGSFFPDGNKIEAEILLRDKNKLSKNPKLTKV